jgi:hypothetical protein
MNIEKIINEELKNFIDEKLANVDDDVNMLYNNYFAKDVKHLEETGEISFKSYETDSSILSSFDSVKAHGINPALIRINTNGVSNSNTYDPINSVISFGVNQQAVSYVKQRKNINNAIRMLGNSRSAKLLSIEFSEEKIKGSIHHELAHWIDDSLHNRHMAGALMKRHEYTRNDKENINHTYIEIEGQIHNIKQLKNKFSDVWDDISFTELLSKSIPLTTVYDNSSGTARTNWVKKLKTRMFREGLLGKNMVNN